MSNRKINQGKIEIDYEESTLIVHYEIVPVQMDDGRVVEISELAKAESKRIKIKSLAPDKNLAQLAADIVDKCKYLHPSRVEEVEQLLIKMRKFYQTNAAAAASQGAQSKDVASFDGKELVSSREQSRRNRDEPKNDYPRRALQYEEAVGREHGGDDDDSLPPASIDQLDDYLDMLYQVSSKSEKEREEGLRIQIQGTGMILKLCRDVMNLEQLIQNTTVMGALARVLQEEFKKSVELTFNILRIFLAFSNFVEMHLLMSNYRIGLLTMKAIEYEIKRFELREIEAKEREEVYDGEIEDAKSLARSDAAAAAKLPETLDRVKRLKAREAAKLKRQQRNQDKLLFVAFYILLNLAEDASVERKMIKKNLTASLVTMLDHTLIDLLVLVTSFLKKLSLYEDNKNDMKSLNLIAKASKFLPCSSPPLINMSLRLLFNLSFDQEARIEMLKVGLVPKLIHLLKTPALRARTLKLLYHLSADDRCKSMFPYTADGVPIVVGMIVNFPQNNLAKELAALAVNISLNPRNAELMATNKGINYLMDRLATTRDPLLLKILRNISQWTFNSQNDNAESSPYRSLWSPHVKILVDVACTDDHDVCIEAIGCLANLTLSDLPSTSSWAKLLKDTPLLSTVSKLLVPGMAQDDLVLEAILLISAVASDGQACNIIASSGIIGSLHQIWHEKNVPGGDIEILLQLTHCFYRLFQFESSREEAMYSTRMVSEVILCLSHRHAGLREAADALAEMILELDRNAKTGEFGALGAQILRKRFEGYNQMWIQETGLGSSSSSFPSYINQTTHESVTSLLAGGGGKNMNYGGGDTNMRMGFADYDRESVLAVRDFGPRFLGDEEKFQDAGPAAQRKHHATSGTGMTARY